MLVRANTRGEGEIQAVFRERAVKGYRDEIREMLTDAAAGASGIMYADAPRDTGNLADSIRTSGPTYRPGGAGGGGFHEARVSAGNSSTPYLIDVWSGTGLWGPFRDFIRPRHKKALLFEVGGANYFSMWSRGQKPQTQWVETAQEEAQLFIRQRLSTLFDN